MALAGPRCTSSHRRLSSLHPAEAGSWRGRRPRRRCGGQRRRRRRSSGGPAAGIGHQQRLTRTYRRRPHRAGDARRPVQGDVAMHRMQRIRIDPGGPVLTALGQGRRNREQHRQTRWMRSRRRGRYPEHQQERELPAAQPGRQRQLGDRGVPGQFPTPVPRIRRTVRHQPRQRIEEQRGEAWPRYLIVRCGGGLAPGAAVRRRGRTGCPWSWARSGVWGEADGEICFLLVLAVCSAVWLAAGTVGVYEAARIVIRAVIRAQSRPLRVSDSMLGDDLWVFLGQDGSYS